MDLSGNSANNAYLDGAAAYSGGVVNATIGSSSWTAGPLGNYYQSGTLLVDAGSRSAGAAGLYHYTTQASQAIEGDSAVDIGYHYVALDTSGQPDSTLWLGIPDYLADPMPTITISSPANNANFNSSRVNVGGTFSSLSMQSVAVNGIPAFINGTSFEAVNVPLSVGANTLSAVLEDSMGRTATTSISITATPDANSPLNDPVQLQASQAGGFYPMAVNFQVTANAPGTFQSVSYDFEGGDAADLIATDLNAVTHTYSAAGQFFPAATVHTSAGRFSSIGGWNCLGEDADHQPPRIIATHSPNLVSTINVANPVGLKWTSDSHLYVLSGSTAAVAEYDSQGSLVRSLSGIGDGPLGLDVDGSGNVYVAMTGDNQVWKFNPSGSSFAADSTFGQGGYIGLQSGQTGRGESEFNTPYDVAVAPDGSGITVSDSGNERVQFF